MFLVGTNPCVVETVIHEEEQLQSFSGNNLRGHDVVWDDDTLRANMVAHPRYFNLSSAIRTSNKWCDAG